MLKFLVVALILLLGDSGPWERGPYEYVVQKQTVADEDAVEPSPATVSMPTGNYQPGNPVYPNVPLWGHLHDNDIGACPLVDGYGWGGLMWPVPSQTIKENRLFMVEKSHRGIDIEAVVGTPVVAATGGVVVWAGRQMSGYGELVALAHGGTYQTIYAHLSSVSVSCGQEVGKGTVLGYSGQTGLATWPHLHFEVRIGGLNYDPLQWLGGYIIIPKTIYPNQDNGTIQDMLDNVTGGSS